MRWWSNRSNSQSQSAKRPSESSAAAAHPNPPSRKKGQDPGRGAPKVTVTRERVSLCQKGVTQWLLFWLTVLSLRSELKRAGGRALSLSSRPPAVEGSLDLRPLVIDGAA